MTDFETEYQMFIEKHSQVRTGQDSQLRHLRLKPEEYEFLKNVWWPTFRSFDNLHPHYDVQDVKDGLPCVDFAYLEPCLKIAIQIDVFEEWRAQTDEDLSLNNRRQSTMVLCGWRIFHYSDVMREKDKEHARLGLKRFLDDWHARSAELKTLSYAELDILGLFSGSKLPMTFREIHDRLTISSINLDKLLYKLTKAHWLRPIPNSLNERCFAVHESKSFVIW